MCGKLNNRRSRQNGSTVTQLIYFIVFDDILTELSVVNRKTALRIYGEDSDGMFLSNMILFLLFYQHFIEHFIVLVETVTVSGGAMHTYTREQLMAINNSQPVPRKLPADVLQQLFGVGLFKPTKRGVRAGSHKQRDIPV